MRMRKLRGPHMKKSMPFENFRTATQPVNLADLEERFDAGAEVTPETPAREGPRQAHGPGQDPRPRQDLEEAHGPAHGFSAAAKETIEAAGGTVD